MLCRVKKPILLHSIQAQHCNGQVQTLVAPAQKILFEQWQTMHKKAAF
jgi:hypothetical protein